jgi:hypothetical protein
MSTESNYPFKEPAGPAPYSAAEVSRPSIHLPFALLTAALAVVMINQTMSVFKQRTSLREGKAQLIEAYKNREPMVKQSADLQAKLQALVLDLLILSKTDEDAKAIVGKYNIQQNVPAGSAPPAETPAEPAK